MTKTSSAAAATVKLAVVNNMPDAALRTTERQWRELMAAARGDDCAVDLRFFSLPEVPRSYTGRMHVADNYTDVAELWDGVDGLIVTGTEPIAANLPDEPYWPALTRLIDWARDNTVSTIFSCLGAHAAVRHLSGIDRRPLGEKLSGIFECSPTGEHSLLAGVPGSWRVPHSRHNELSEAELVANAYQVLAHSPEAGADLFAKDYGSLFVFLQGHLEYDGGALLREYRRDIKRFLAGESARYPAMPRNYFDPEVAAVLAEFRAQAIEDQGIDLIENFPADAARSRDFPWRDPAICIARNWLHYISTHKAASPESAAV
ncbi:MAG: homoserine O-succinyltransferase [Alphaproteobacteria bacterium]|nr:homoserine O-succinyltransferase [Alphaproteobacteria bacterium]